MTVHAAAESVVGAPTAPPSKPPQRRGLARRLWKVPVFVWKYWIGVVLCQNLLLSLLVVGWTYRLMQRSVFKGWWKRSEIRKRETGFADFLEGAGATRPLLHWPNWFIRQNFSRRPGETGGVTAQLGDAVRSLFHSLYLNGKTGVEGLFNTWVLTLPGCALWLFAWFAGWNNSFHKGYELAWVGPTTGLLGVALFMAAMLYIPMAQARQAATGEWRSFYQLRVVRVLIRQRLRSTVLLAGLYSALSLPVTVLMTLPAFFDQMWPDLAELSDAEALAFLRVYYFRVALVAFPIYLVLKLAAARLYASAVIAALKRGRLEADDLSTDERAVLERLELLQEPEPRTRHVVLAAIGWTGTRVARVGAYGLAVFLWFTFVAQIFIGQFLFYHPVGGWLNQPLVQLPHFSYVPTDLRDAGSSVPRAE